MLGRFLNKLLPNVLINKIKVAVRKKQNLYYFLVKNKKKIVLSGLASVSIAFLIILILLTNPTFTSRNNGNNSYYTKEQDTVSVLLTLPNENSAPHPVNLPLKITFSQPLNDEVDLSLLKHFIKFEPLALFSLSISKEDKSTLEIIPTIKLNQGTQYTVTILAGDYGGNFILKEPYKYYFLTQGGSMAVSADSKYTFSTSISKYEPNKKRATFPILTIINKMKPTALAIKYTSHLKSHI